MAYNYGTSTFGGWDFGSDVASAIDPRDSSFFNNPQAPAYAPNTHHPAPTFEPNLIPPAESFISAASRSKPATAADQVNVFSLPTQLPVLIVRHGPGRGRLEYRACLIATSHVLLPEFVAEVSWTFPIDRNVVPVKGDHQWASPGTEVEMCWNFWKTSTQHRLLVSQANLEAVLGMLAARPGKDALLITSTADNGR